MDKTILLCICHYNDAQRVLAFARHVLSLPRAAGWKLEIALSDNSCNWPVEQELPRGVLLVQPGKNLGYLPGCAAAFDAWMAASAVLPAWTGVFNTDLTLAPDFFTKLARIEAADDVGVLAPYIGTTVDDRNHNPFMRKPLSRERAYFYTVITGVRPLYRLFVLSQPARAAVKKVVSRRVATDEDAAPQNDSIYAAHGAAMLLHQRFFERGGTIRYRGFMYGEEIHLAEQTRRCGLLVKMAPTLRIVHEGHFTTGAMGIERIRQWQETSSRIIWEDYFASA